MKILQINTTVNSGSTGRIAENLGQLALRKGHESYIAFGRGNRPSTSRLIKIGNDFYVILHGMKSWLLDRHGFGSSMPTRALVKDIQEIGPDIVHLHNIHGYFLNAPELFSFLSRAEIPVVWTFHDCWPFTGHCAFYDRFDCQKWQTECHTCPNLKGYPASIGIDNSKRNYREKKELFNLPEQVTLVAPCQWMKENLQRSFLNGYPIRVIYNGIDLKVFKPRSYGGFRARYGLTGKKVVLGVANVWDWRKGFKDFLQLGEALGEDYRLVLIGLEKKQIKVLPELILGISHTESMEELSSWYSLADVFVNPTYVDNFPTTNLEALACGTPVVTYSTGGSPEAIDKHTGLAVPKGNIRKLNEAIISIAQSDKNKYQTACRERALAQFNLETSVKKYLQLYEKILQVGA